VAVQSVTEKFDGRDHSVSDKGVRTYTRVFEATTNSNYTGPVAVRAALFTEFGIERGAAYSTDTESDTGCLCKKITPRQSDNPKVWEIRVEYDSETDDEEENPLDRPAVYAWSFQPATRAVWKDIDGHGILNSAGQYFDPPIEIDDSRPVLTVTRNEADFDPALAISYQDAVNDSDFLGFDAGQAKVANISATSQFENDVAYWQVQYEFHFRREGWELQILDQGRYAKVGGKLVRIPEYDSAGNAIPNSHVADPVPLDGNGARLDSPTPATVEFLPFTVYEEKDFSAFNI
jgi:hypothetical protein